MLEMQRIKVEPQFCRGCEACLLACSLVHEGESNPSTARLVVRKDMPTFTFNIIICEQCADPECAAACPSGAIVVNADGLVRIVEDDCLQCGACETACPYHAIFYNPKTGAYFKCDLCHDYAGGPACVEFCPVGALTLGGN